MSAIQIADNVYSVGVKDPGLTVFDIIMKVNHGTTYNAYLVKGQKIALIDTVKAAFTDEYFTNVEEIVAIDKVDYLVVNHTEPDHSGAIPALLKKNPGIKLVSAMPAIPFVKNVLNVEADIEGIKDNTSLDLGGKTLTFRGMPYMHWPDTMMEYLAEDRVLFSNDGFAAHLSSDTLWADEVDQKELEVEFHEYWDKIMRPWSSYIRRNMPKLDDFDIEVVAPSHGPIYRKNARDRLDRYKEWAADKSEGGNRVTIFYTSNYGNTKSMAERFAGELDKHGLKATLAEVTETDPDKARDLVESSRAIMIGTPTFNGDAVKPIWDLVSLFSSIERFGKKAAVFGSYGWGGEAPKMVAERLTGLKLKVYEKPYTARLIPSDDDLDQLTAYAEGFAEFIEAEK